MTWYEIFLRMLKENEVRLVTLVPDNVLTPLIRGIAADITSSRLARPAKTRPSASRAVSIWPAYAARS
jgi:hypothetical protein